MRTKEGKGERQNKLFEEAVEGQTQQTGAVVDKLSGWIAELMN